MKKGEDNEALARLMKLTGERPEIPLSIESRVRHAVQREWQGATAEPSGDKVYEEVHKSWRRGALRSSVLRWVVPLGIAATGLIAVFITAPPDIPPAAVAATVSRVVGNGALALQYSAGTSVSAGDTITSGAGEGLSLLLARSESLRIDANTEIRIDAADQFTLLSGRVYADTGQFVYRDGGLIINTDFGTVTDVGTQFAVTANMASLEVAVREGRVDVRNQTQEVAARMGERLTMAAGEAAIISSLDTHDEYWHWVSKLSPMIDLANKSLLDFLKWAARETGRELQFESNELRMLAMRTDVRGSVEGLTPDEALAAILATTTVSYRLDDGRIIVTSRAP